MTLAYIPSPSVAVWQVGPIPVRAYALFIILGILVACVVTELRLRQRGAPRYAVLDLAVWAVPAGIIGGRLYHVITTPDAFFGSTGNPADIVKVWEGGLGIWGAIAGGAVGVWFGCRQLRLPFRVVADAAAVGIPLAQAVGRLGNWFNNELYGSETTLPWGLRVHAMRDGRAEIIDGEPVVIEGALYHPTFLYELLWNVGVAILVWQVGKRLRLGGGRQFALYVMAYTAGRFWIELLRIDDTDAMPVETANEVIMVAGVRINAWVSLLVFLAALAYFLRKRGAQEEYLVAHEHGYRMVTAEEYREHREEAARVAVPAGAGIAEAGTAEAGTAEAGTAEAGTAEAGTAEAGTAEAGTAEAGTAGAADSGEAEAGGDAADTGDATETTGVTDGGDGPAAGTAPRAATGSAGTAEEAGPARDDDA